MRKLIFFSMLFLASIVSHAQLTTSYGGLVEPNPNNAGQSGNYSSFFGGYAGEANTGHKNTFIGFKAGWNNTGGYENTFVGAGAGHDNIGIKNVFFGSATGRFNTTGSYNTYLGNHAGFSSETGAGNVFLGNKAGYNELGSNLLYIDNDSISKPLIYGDFADDILGLNAHVGIGTHTPESVLNIVADNPAITLTNTNGATLQLASAQAAGNYSPFSNDGDQVIRMLGSDNIIFSTSATEGSNRNFKFASHDSLLMVINDTGKVSIGTVPQTPGNYKLYVKDGILTEKVRVEDCANWADFVFEEDYYRNSTEEVEQFIKQNKHLPNVPSAKEVNENGIDMAEMDATLLRQIEELWLHVIELKKENETLKNEVENLQK